MKPVFVDSDPANILSSILADFENLTGKTIEPAHPEYAIASAIAYHKSLALNRVNEAGTVLLVDYAIAPVLDSLAALFNITRLPSQGAVCTLGFTIVTGHLQVVIPIGTRIASTDGNVIFATDDDVIVPIGVDYVEITATCQTYGSSGNGYGIGVISVLQDPYAYISTVTNLDITQGGATEESDDELRSRVKLATSKFSVAGSRNAYIYWAKSASSLISDVAVATYEDDNTIPFGEVDIYALLDNGELPTTAVNDKILTILSNENVRPLTDTVVVKTPTERKYSLEVNIVKYPDYVGSALTSDIYALLLSYTSEKKQKLGLDIVASTIESLCRINGIYDIDVTIIPTSGTLTGRNLVVNPWQVAKLENGGITITIIGSNNG